MVPTVLSVLGGVLIVAGLIAMTLSLVGLVRMPTLYLKLHALAVATGIGVTAVLVAAVGTGNVEVMTRAAVVAMFIVLTAPLSSHAIARAERQQQADRPPDEPDAATDAR